MVARKARRTGRCASFTGTFDIVALHKSLLLNSGDGDIAKSEVQHMLLRQAIIQASICYPVCPYVLDENMRKIGVAVAFVGLSPA
jgi:hypothetical protein